MALAGNDDRVAATVHSASGENAKAHDAGKKLPLLMLGALGMLISSGIKQLENFAGVMNFVIFPMFFASSALYPLWRILESSPMLYYVCQFNPFTHAVELIRFALYGQVNWTSLAVVGGCTIAFMVGAIYAYDPSRGLIRRGPAGGEA